MGVQNLSKSVKICQSYWQKFAATFFMSHSVFGKGVCVCLSVCLSVRKVAWKLLQIICFLLGSFVDWSKILEEFARQDHVSRSR